nr:unnamed protein product [Callosobruchus chinensis]
MSRSKIPRVVGLKGKRQIGALTAAEGGALVTCVFSMSASDQSLSGTPNLILPDLAERPDADIATKSTLANVPQNVCSFIQRLQTPTSFESLLLDKVNKHPNSVVSTRRKIDEKLDFKVVTDQHLSIDTDHYVISMTYIVSYLPRLNLQHIASNAAGTSSSNPTAELELHQRQAKHALSTKQIYIDQSKLFIVEDTVVICFELQKTLPTTLLTTNKVYYFLQLWTYNLCILDLTNDSPNMYGMRAWHHEDQYIKSLSPAIAKVIAYSDSYGGQNKNKNLAKLFMYIVKSTNIKRIDHKFFLPGHSFMECDRDICPD